MTDKDKIKEEIERQIDYAEDDTRYTESYREGLIAAYQTIKAFIDSLPEENHFEDKSEMVSEDLDKLVISLEETIGTSPHSREVIKEHLQKAVDWQKKKDQETIELAEDHAMLAGMNKMKEEMMKNAVYGYVSLCHDYPRRRSLVAIADGLVNFEYAEKVKIIIVKEEK